MAVQADGEADVEREIGLGIAGTCIFDLATGVGIAVAPAAEPRRWHGGDQGEDCDHLVQVGVSENFAIDVPATSACPIV